MSRSLVVNLFWLAFGILVAATVIGLVTLWPDDGRSSGLRNYEHRPRTPRR